MNQTVMNVMLRGQMVRQRRDVIISKNYWSDQPKVEERNNKPKYYTELRFISAYELNINDNARERMFELCALNNYYFY